jgi:hypothetical protein
VSDALATIFAMIRAELPQLDECTAARIELHLRNTWSGERRAMVSVLPKRQRLLELRLLPQQARANPKDVQRLLGVSRSHAYRLVTLLR